MLRINDIAPDFKAVTTIGEITLHEYLSDSWGVLFSHPKDFTPVCTTELGYMAKIEDEFSKRNCKLIGLSVDSVDDHLRWKKDIEETQGSKVNYPLIADEDLNIAKLYNMLPATEKNDGKRTAMTNATVRSIFMIDPQKKIRMMLTYPMTTGRNFNEIIRVLDSIQLSSENKVATPANWKKDEDVIIVPAVSDDEAKEIFGDFKTIKPYLRYTKL
tara:strand:- start:604 stop:1248 length:645 start_codon:yes stop_codon:yes gene_type:complete